MNFKKFDLLWTAFLVIYTLLNLFYLINDRANIISIPATVKLISKTFGISIFVVFIYRVYKITRK